MMSKYSLINVMKEKDGLVSGYWIQDHHGTLETAKQLADDTNEVNSNKLNIAVVDYVSTTAAILSYFTDLKRIV